MTGPRGALATVERKLQDFRLNKLGVLGNQPFPARFIQTTTEQ